MRARSQARRSRSFRRIMRKLWPAPQSTAWRASPRLPWSQFRRSSPSFFMCPIIGSMPLPRLPAADRYRAKPGPPACAASSVCHASACIAWLGITANLPGQPRCLPVIVLPKLDAQPICQLHQVLATSLQQAAVGRIGNRLLHERCINNHLLQATRLDDLGFPGRLDGDRQQPFHAFLANPFAPTRQG